MVLTPSSLTWVPRLKLGGFAHLWGPAPLPELTATASGKGRRAFQQWTLRNSSPGLPSGQGAFYFHHRTWASSSLAQWGSEC